MKNTSSRDRQKILFVMRSTEYLHYYRTIIVALLRRGNNLRLLCDKKWSEESSLAIFDELKKEFPAFSYGWAVPRTDAWRDFLFHTREILSYRRYLVVRGNRQSQYYEDRYLNKNVMPTFRRILGISGMKQFLRSGLGGCVLQAVEWLAPPFPAVSDDIRSYNPGVIVAVPINLRFGSADLEYLKAGKKMRIPTVLPVLSWDNLTTKSLMHVFPDRLLAWNDAQQEEAKEHQQYPADRIRIVGASVFDSWFAAHSPSQTREEFCARHGLQPSDPIVTYLGSSGHMARDETWLVEALRDAFDNADDLRVQRTQIIIRPHGSNSLIYGRLKGAAGIIILPEKGTLPNSPGSLQLFYDTLFHSVAAIDGVNTTAIIDSIIAKKPGIAILTDKYARTQRETKHFNQLTDARALYLAKDVQEVPCIVACLLNGDDELKENRMAFIKRYVRPRGLEREAGEWAADEIEQMTSFS